MFLQGAEVVHLGTIGKVGGEKLGASTLARKDRLGAKTGVSTSKRSREGTNGGIPACPDPLMGELPSLQAKLLDHVVGQDCPVTDRNVKHGYDEEGIIA